MRFHVSSPQVLDLLCKKRLLRVGLRDDLGLLRLEAVTTVINDHLVSRRLKEAILHDKMRRRRSRRRRSRRRRGRRKRMPTSVFSV
jgi:hypothetical protein